MAYSHLRLRKTLALVRILTGILFLFFGAHKISSWQYAKIEFPQFLWDATHGAGVGFYGQFLRSVISGHPSKYAVLVGLVELFIGVGLVLGLAVRPVSLMGMLYMTHLTLATWRVPGPDEAMWRYLDHEAKLIVLFFLFLLFAVGHAGENWGLGSLYHHHRHRQWEKAEEEAKAASSSPEPASIGQHSAQGEDEVRESWELDKRWTARG